MPEFNVSIVLENAVWEDGPEGLVETLGSMSPEEALDYVCEMAVDPDIKQVARLGWVLSDVFDTNQLEEDRTGLGTKDRPYYFVAVLSRSVTAESPALAEAAVRLEAERLLSPDEALDGWQMIAPPQARPA